MVFGSATADRETTLPATPVALRLAASWLAPGGYARQYREAADGIPVTVFQDTTIQGAPSWDETVEEARAVLAPEREKIEALASLIEETVKSTADGMVKTRMMDGDTRPYRELVSAEKLYSIVDRKPPALVAQWLQTEIGGGQAASLGS
jgi:hypothetical protein